jgi:hypothetical protein
LTTQLIRLQAKEIAGAEYDKLRVLGSDRFARENPDQKRYVAEHWPHFVDAARASLTYYMTLATTPEHEKEAIMEALVEHTEQSEGPRAVEVLQYTFQPREREDVRMIDENLQLPSVGM